MMTGIPRPLGARRLMPRRASRCCALLAVPARAQFFSFGQNKIQYRKLDWRMMKGPHVDLYYYSAEADLAPAALAYAEASYDTLSVQFGHTVPSRIPLIVYASHTDFEQTNILPFTPPEGLLGATDFLKRRVALPFRGNFAEFRHTMRHEMVHVFQLDMLVESYNLAPRARRYNFPLWWTEGTGGALVGGAGRARRDGHARPHAERPAAAVQAAHLRHQRHRVSHRRADPPVARRYLRRLAHGADVQGAQPPRQLRGRHPGGLRPDDRPAERRVPARDAAAVLSVGRHPGAAPAARDRGRAAGREGRGHRPDTGGVESPGRIAYVSPANGYVSIYQKSLAPRSKGHSVVTGGRTAEIESFHAFDSRMDASRPGLLLFTARYGDRDALFVWDLERRKATGRYQFPELVSLLSPHWMPDGRSIVVSGLSERGVSDLYRVSLPGGELEPLTNDHYQDLDPSPSPDGRRLVFASDRTADGRGGAVESVPARSGLRRHDPADLRRLAGRVPALGGGDGRIYFTSDRDGVLNVFSVDSAGEGRRETSAWTGAFDAVPLPEGGPGRRRVPRPELEPLPDPGRLRRRTRSASRGCLTPPRPPSGAGTRRATRRPASPPAASRTAGGSRSTSPPATRS